MMGSNPNRSGGMEHRCLLKRITSSHGIGESEVLRQAFIEYAKSISFNNRKVHGKI